MTRSDSGIIQTEGLLGRRQFIAFGVSAFVVAGFPLAIERRRSLRVTRRSVPIMGTIAQFAVVHHDAAIAEAAIDAAMVQLRFVVATMSRFDHTTEIGQANRRAAQGPVAIGRSTAMVLSEAMRWAEATNGAYDPAVGGASELWDVLHRHEPPPQRDVAALAGRGFFRHVELEVSGTRSRVRFHDPLIHLDLGAIAKGYAVDRAVGALRFHGITKAVVVIGGDLYALGSATDGGPWQIGIQSPTDDRELAGMLDAEDSAIATSGTYRRFFRYRGVRYHHLMDPDTASPRTTPVQSYTVRANTCMHADVASTALYGRAADDANQILARLIPGARVERIL